MKEQRVRNLDNEKRDCIDLTKLRVNLVTDYYERADVETVLARYHPLGSKKAIGRRLCYSVSYNGEWVAVALFDAPVKRNKLRERCIGWSDSQREIRLCHIAGNSRYLIAEKFRGVENLASKALSLITERISSDWMKQYGVPLLAVETYVDPEHNGNQGTCYTAAGWEKLGYSSGYQVLGEERTHSKFYFLKALHSNSYAALKSDIPHSLLTGIKPVSGESNNNYVLDATKFDVRALQKDLATITDPRGRQGKRYRFLPLLSLCIAAAVSGYTQYRQIADWIAKLPSTERARFGLPGDRVPDESTISYLLRQIDPAQLQSVLSAWLLKTYKKEVDFSTVIMDGKALRGTSSDTNTQHAFLNVFANDIGIVIAHEPTSKGGAEKNTAKEVVNSTLNLEGKIVLADALHTDKPFIDALEKKSLVCAHC